MQRKIKTTDLKIGMYVMLPASWFSHPFLKNKFNIKSQGEIERIIDSGFYEVLIDDSKERPAEEKEKRTNPQQSDGDDRYEVQSRKWEAEALIPAELREAIHDKKLAPEKKAAVVYKSSLTIMEGVLEEPTAEKIQEVKAGIAEVVDVIISDDDTSKYLLSITSHDYYTYTHSVRVGVFSIMLAKALYKDSHVHDMHELGAGFFLHDIGKTRINPDIINKPGRLTEEEWKEMRTHPFQGYKILSDTNQLTKESRIIVLQHHEWNNGKGYPNGLTGNEIHEYARICSIADVYDALTSDRPYRQKKTPFDALSIMKEEMDNHFGEALFQKFILLLL
jgi:HD-GYP domain-containing protein (c-di-GMP phosphodiesterase class II)